MIKEHQTINPNLSDQKVDAKLNYEQAFSQELEKESDSKIAFCDKFIENSEEILISMILSFVYNKSL